MKKNIVILVILIVVAVGIVGGFFYFKKQKNSPKPIGILSSQEAGNKAIDYINKNLLQSGTAASLKEIKEENGLYKITLKILQSEKEQEGIVYASRDGKLLFATSS